MGVCISTEQHNVTIDINKWKQKSILSAKQYNITLNANEWEQKTTRPVTILREYQQSDVSFSNTNQFLLNRDMTGLKKFAADLDPYMHYKGKNPKEKNKLRQHRLSKDHDELLLLGKMWKLYLLSQRFTDWGNLAKIHNREKVFCAIRLFLETRNEILDILERIDRKSESESFVST